MFNANGDKIGGETSLDILLTGTQSMSTMTSLGNGNIAVVMVDLFSGVYELSASIYDSNLNPVKDFGFFASGAFPVVNPTVTALAGGSFLVAYEVDNSVTDSDIFANIISPTGIVGPQIALLNQTDLSALPEAAALSNGNAVIVYQSQFLLNAPTDIDVLYSIVNSSGAIVKASFVIGANDDPATEFDGRVAALKGGGFVVTWTDHGTLTTDIHATIYDNAGNALAGAVDITVNTTTAGDQLSSDVVALQSGFLVSWEDSSTGHAFAQRFDDIGHKIGVEFDVAAGLNATEHTIDAALLADGRVAYAASLDFSGNTAVANLVYDLKAGAGSDFDGNLKDDILFRSDNGTVSVWDNGQIAGAHWIAPAGTIANGWHFAGKGDFDGNGKSDILWVNDNGTASVWDNGQIGTAHWIANPGTVVNGWHFAGTGDFDGNGVSDILWLHDNGTASVWDNGQIGGAHWIAGPGTVTGSWHLGGIGDFDGNGKSDILWLNDNGMAAVWDNGQSGTAHATANSGTLGGGWHFAATGDFDGNGKSDILWTHDNGMAAVWDNGQIVGAQVIAAPGALNGWHFATTGDFDRNGNTDIVWLNDNGSAAIWDNGLASGAHAIADPGTVANGWHIA